MSEGQARHRAPGPAIRLRPFGRGDIPTLLGWVDSPEFLLQWAGRTSSGRSTRPSSKPICNRRSRRSTRSAHLPAIDETSGAVVGHIGLRDICPIHGGAMVSCVLVGEAAGRSRASARR
jgi:hypothetical protein